MNTLNGRLREAMSRISTERDIVTSAKIKAEAKAGHKKSLPKFKMSVPIVVCSLILVCGITVSAASFGWMQKLFGSTSFLVENKMDDYKLKVGDVKIENAEGVPYKFTLGDVISDGYCIYANVLIEDIEVEDPDAYKQDVIYSGQFNFFSASPVNNYNKRFRYSTWEILDTTENTVNSAILVHYNKKIEKGDVFEFILEDNNRRMDYTNHIDAAENDRAFLASLSFEIKSDVKDLKKSFDVNQTAIFKDRWPWSPEWGGEAPDENKLTKLEMNVNTVGISPFGFEVKGTVDSSQPIQSNALCSWGNIWLIYKNGDRVSITPKGSQMENNGDYYDVDFYGNFSASRRGVYSMDVKDLNEIEAIGFDGFTLPME